jgi:hypothetical protein
MLADDEFDEYPDQIFTDDEREAGIPELLRKNKLNQSRGKNKSFQRYKSVHVDIPNKKTPKRIRDILNWLFFSKFTTHSHDYFTIKKQSKGRLKSGQIVILFEWLETEGIVNYFKGWRSKINGNDGLVLSGDEVSFNNDCYHDVCNNGYWFISKVLSEKKYQPYTQPPDWNRLNDELNSFTRSDLMFLRNQVQYWYNDSASWPNGLKSIGKKVTSEWIPVQHYGEIFMTISKRLNLEVTTKLGQNRKGYFRYINDVYLKFIE